MKGVAAWTGAILAALLALAGMTTGPPGYTEFVRSAFIMGWTAYALVGLVIALRRPDHPVGWILLSLAIASNAGMIGQELARADSVASAPNRVLILSLIGNLWVLAFALVGWLLAVFPTGRLPSPRWRLMALLLVVVVTAGLLTSGFDSARIPLSILIGNDEIAAALNDLGQGISGIGTLVLFVAGAAAMGVRFARSRGRERQQLKWFAYAAFVLVAAFVASTVAYFTPELRALDPAAPVPPAMFGGIPFIAGLVSVPIAAAIAILRYRLYDIDLLINRTLVYGALTVSLGAVYVGSVIAFQGLLSGFAGGGGLAVAASTLAVAALFQPARRRIQRVVDRRFYRSRYDAQRTVEAFSARLRHQLDLTHLTDELRGVVEETLHPAGLSVWLRDGGS